MARSVVGEVISASSSNDNPAGMLDFIVNYYAVGIKNCPPTGQIVAKCDITQNDTQLNLAIRQSVADAVNNKAGSIIVVASDIVGCNV